MKDPMGQRLRSQLVRAVRGEDEPHLRRFPIGGEGGIGPLMKALPAFGLLLGLATLIGLEVSGHSPLGIFGTLGVVAVMMMAAVWEAKQLASLVERDTLGVQPGQLVVRGRRIPFATVHAIRWEGGTLELDLEYRTSFVEGVSEVAFDVVSEAFDAFQREGRAEEATGARAIRALEDAAR